MAVAISNGSTDNISATTFSMPTNTNATAMAWFLLNGALANFRLAVNIDPNFGFGADATGANFLLSTILNDYSGPALNFNTWYHGAVAVKSNTTGNHDYSAYVNGNQVIQVNDTAGAYTSYTSVTVGNLGNSVGNSFPLQGNVKDVRVWRRLLTADQIREEMLSGYPVNSPGLVLWSSLGDNITHAKGKSNNYLWTSTGTTSLASGGPLLPTSKRNVM